MPYVIRNCPACRQYQVSIYTCDDLYDCDLQRCQDCTDCVMKQIVERCKKVRKCDNCELNGKQECIFANCTAYYIDSFAKELLQLLDIQEVE